MRLICLGFGYTARAFVRLHRHRFAAIAATTRGTPVGVPGITPVPLGVPGALNDAVAAADVILHSAAPDEAGDPFIARVGAALAGQAAGRHVLYLSTVGVYGDHAGAWVDEAADLRPTSRRSLLRRATEQAWLGWAGATGAHVQIFRLAGIYGPGRGPLENVRSGKARRIIKPGQVFNRIHVEDIADTLMAALDRPGLGAIWNVSDEEPAPPQDVIAYAAHCMGLPPPPEIAYADADMTPMAASFYSENKRVDSRAIRERLGVVLRYPTYREGLAALAGAEK